MGSLGSLGGFFDPQVLYALLSGVVVGGGVALLVVALRGVEVRDDGVSVDRVRRLGEIAQFVGRRGSLAVGVGLLVLLLTRWTVAGIGSGVLVFFWDRLFGGAAQEKAAMRRVEALAGWTESLRDTIAGAVGLEQAIPASARAAAPALRPHLESLVDRLRARTPLPEALQHLADEIDDASADIIVAALILNARLRGPGLRQVLGALAKSAREEIDMRHRVMAQRSSTRRSVQIVVAVSVAFVLGLAVFNRGFVQPYDSPLGQLVLAIVCGLFGLGFWWLRKLSVIETPDRFLVRGGPDVRFVRPQSLAPAGPAASTATQAPAPAASGASIASPTGPSSAKTSHTPASPAAASPPPAASAPPALSSPSSLPFLTPGSSFPSQAGPQPGPQPTPQPSPQPGPQPGSQRGAPPASGAAAPPGRESRPAGRRADQ